ncbi:MAG: hypothetical protein K940chlam8_00577 [Chlamydiae bacterium]|nr:hypothetical protein [Chlamydiota bacterium]
MTSALTCFSPFLSTTFDANKFKASRAKILFFANNGQMSGLEHFAKKNIGMLSQVFQIMFDGSTLSVTALQVATMARKYDFVARLLEFNCNKDHTSNGYAALHFASFIPDPKMIAVLLKGGCHASMDPRGATHEDILRMRTLPDPKTQTFYLKDASGAVVQRDGAVFSTLRKATLLSDRFYVDAEYLVHIWMQNVAGKPWPPTSLNGRIQRDCLLFLQSPREKVYLEQQDGFFVARAKEAIKPFEIIGIYRGKVDLSHKKRNEELKRIYQQAQKEAEQIRTSPLQNFSELFASLAALQKAHELTEESFHILEEGAWTFDSVDGREFRNLVPEIVDSFPNAATFGVTNVLGLPSVCVLVALDPIPPGGLICYNYGIHHNVKIFPRQEFRKEALVKEIKALLQQHSFIEWMEILETFFTKQQLTPVIPNSETAKIFIEKFGYVLSTFSSCAYLIREKILKIDDVVKVFSSSTIFEDRGSENYNKLLILYKGIQKDPSILDELGDQISILSRTELLQRFAQKGLLIPNL